jgi:hypothetical protein
MASVTLDEPDRPGTVLPDVCVKCGRLAPDRVPLSFASMPRGLLLALLVGVLLIGPAPFVLLFLLIRSSVVKRMDFGVPLCPVHKKHLLVRFWGIPLAAALLVAVAIFGLAVADRDHHVGSFPRPGEKSRVTFVRATPLQKSGGVLAAGAVAGLIVLTISTAVLRDFHRPRASEVGDLTITLDRVSPEFVLAYEDSRRPVPLPTDAGTYWRVPKPARSETAPSQNQGESKITRAPEADD